jgi:predicted alpha-1,6-mannanase (GH76 family)
VLYWLYICFLLAVEADPRASAILGSLQSHYYSQSSGLWIAPAGWWNSGNALEALCEYITYSNDRTFFTVINNVFTHTTFPQTENGFFDDAQWWGIAWVRAYQLTKDTRYLQRAVQIWNYVYHDAWDTSKCGGGVWWNSQKNYKNAVTNELFLVFSSLLYLENTSNTTYRNYAELEWKWFESSGMINAQNLINDGLDGSCKNNRQTTWTYNQGIILGGLYYLQQITSNSTLLSIASNIASATESTLVYSDGVLREPCEPNCGNDGQQFKGIFMRYLGILLKGLNGANKTKFSNWITLNADAVWNKARNPSDSTCGLVWNGPTNQPACAISQSSCLDCLNAAMTL